MGWLLIVLVLLAVVIAAVAMSMTSRGSSKVHAPSQQDARKSRPAVVQPGKRVGVQAADYDASAFLNEAGGFVFPKYRVQTPWVSITDNTEYKEIWSELSRDEKRKYSIGDFEEQFRHEGIYFEVCGFWDALQGAKKSDLGDLGKLAGHVDTLQELWEEQFEVDERMKSSAPVEPHDLTPDLGAELVRLGVVTRLDLSSEGNFARWLNEKTVQWLKGVAKDRQLATSGTKSDLVQRIALLPDMAKLTSEAYYCSANEKFSTLIAALVRKYVERIKSQTAAWHPLHRTAVWEAAAEENQHSAPRAVLHEIGKQPDAPTAQSRA